ncbi:Imm1 family immunity protein [Streptomyces sp. NPDC001691]|uniref:Imm1 family immunity protein n=1 Tax=Streptomyces sp. NPDC001691 TaxID=3364600 RepID=UPI0036BB017E
MNVILVAHFFGEYRCADGLAEMSAVIDSFLAGRPGQNDLPPRSASECETAFFGFAEAEIPAGVDPAWWEGYPDNSLLVTINFKNGYGGLAWMVNAGRAEQINKKTNSDMADWPWVSDSQSPPDFDPEILIDPEGPSYHDIRNALPGSQVRAAIEEFCRTGTGERPTCIQWVKGQETGERIVDSVA